MKETTIIIIFAIIISYFLYLGKSKENLTNEECNRKLCNTRIQKFIKNNWSFNDSTKFFKECNNCKSIWYRNPEKKISEDGKLWSMYEPSQNYSS